MRPSRARRRTVDSLTCKTSASWRAVKNSSRASSLFGCASFTSLVSVCPLLPGGFEREGGAVDGRAFDFDILRGRLHPVGLRRQTVSRADGREPEGERPRRVRDAAVEFLERAVFLNARQLDLRAVEAAAGAAKDAPPDEGYRALVNGQVKPLLDVDGLARAHLGALHPPHLQALLAERQTVRAGLDVAEGELALGVGRGLRDLHVAAAQDDKHAARAHPRLDAHAPADGARRRLLLLLRLLLRRGPGGVDRRRGEEGRKRGQ